MIKFALCQKDGLYREALISLLSTNERFEHTVDSKSMDGPVSAMRVHDAKVLIVVAGGLDDEDAKKLVKFAEAPVGQLLVIGTQKEVDDLKIVPAKLVSPSAKSRALFQAIEDLARKEGARPPLRVLTNRAINAPVTVLTPRENDIALKVAEGLSNRDIAGDLDLAEQTVKNLVSVIMRKLGCRNRVQVALQLSKKHAGAKDIKREA